MLKLMLQGTYGHLDRTDKDGAAPDGGTPDRNGEGVFRDVCCGLSLQGTHGKLEGGPGDGATTGKGTADHGRDGSEENRDVLG